MVSIYRLVLIVLSLACILFSLALFPQKGLPLIYDVKSKCIKLLDDGSGRDPLEEYNFGSAANYLFRPCTNDAGEEEVSHSVMVLWKKCRKKI